MIIFKRVGLLWSLSFIFLAFWLKSWLLMAIGLFVFLPFLLDLLQKDYRHQKDLDSLAYLVQKRLQGDSAGYFMEKSSSKMADIARDVENLSKQTLDAHQAMMTAQGQLSRFVAHASFGVLVLDEAKIIRLSNPCFSQLLSTSQELEGQPLAGLSGCHELTVLVNQSYESGKKLSKEIELGSNQPHVLEVSVIPTFNQEGYRQLLVFLYDVTKIRRLEKTRADFIANASHELRTPITSIHGFAETLLEMPEKNAKKRRFMDIIYRESLRLEAIVGDILKLSSIEHLSPVSDHQEVLVAGLIREISHTLTKTITEKQLNWSIQGDKDLRLACDSKALSQVLLNLFSNAIKYTEPFGHVETRFFRQEDRLIIEITDNGIGIPFADQERIFERFYRVNKGRSRQTGGTGLGLAIVKSLLQRMNASISLKSNLGKGSQFTISLPYQSEKV